MYSKLGTAAPSPADVIAQTSPQNAVDSFFGQVETKKGKNRASIELTQLTPGTSYIIYVVAQDRANNVSDLVGKVDFRTIKRRNPLRFEIHTSTLSTVDVVKSGLSRFLAVSEDTLYHVGTDPTLLSRRLASVSDYTYEFAI